jgi:hypothetical protein
MKSLPYLAAALALAACSSDEKSSSSSLTQPPGECGGLETHVFGVYAAPAGEVTVRLDRPGRHELVLTAHDSVTWHVETSNGAEVVGVYAVGIHEQTVHIAGDVKVVTHSKDAGDPYGCAYAWPAWGNDCDTDQLLKLSSKIVRHNANSFHGCKMATQFTVAENLLTTSDCGTMAGSSQQNDFVAGCDGTDSCDPNTPPIFL